MESPPEENEENIVRGPRPGAPPPEVQKQMTAAVHGNEEHNLRMQQVKRGGLTLGVKATATSEGDKRGSYHPPEPPKGSTG
jgi:hypothetical protein